MSPNSLSPIELKAVSERSLQRAGDSLSALLGHGVRLSTSGVETLALENLSGLGGLEAQGPLAALTFGIGGDGEGMLLILFPMTTVVRMLSTLLGGQAGSNQLSALEESALREIGNILASSFLSELADLTGRRYLPSPPQIHLEGVPQLAAEMREALSRLGSDVVVVQGLFEDAVQHIQGRFFILPEMLGVRPGAQRGKEHKV